MASYATPPIVMDTNVLVAGACRNAGSRAYLVLCHVLRGRVPLILTPAIALEYQDVLLRPAVLALTGQGAPARANATPTDKPKRQFGMDKLTTM